MKNNIYILWLQGWDAAPELVKKCALSWIKKNPEYSVHLIEDKNLKNFMFCDIPKHKMTIQAFSDMFRIQLLKNKNGIWVDATCYCNRPLKSWIDYNKNDFFAFSNPTEDKLIASWFLYSRHDNIIINKWYQETIEFWSEEKHNIEYFWFHKLFNKCYYSNTEFKKMWDSIDKLSCNISNSEGPHYFVPYDRTFIEKRNIIRLKQIKELDIPLFKLTWKTKFNNDSLIGELLND